ncbi:MAG: hypothetical protein IKW37_01505 [Bacteroidaceae bacterium]|nr:hypothetical protein [Bacteroidaceae bacterium]
MIESALLKHLWAQTDLLSPYLANYKGKMAIFNQEAPADTDRGWDTRSQYGRLVFALDLTEDTERKYSGTLAVDVICEKGKQLPEEMEPIVRNLIDGYFFSTEETTMAAQWNASNYFTDATEKIIGVTLTFGMLAFPKQLTCEPDPIALLNAWTSTELKNLLQKEIRVIGHDIMESAWKPTNEVPAIYWRLTQINPTAWIPDTLHCSWHTAVISGHIMTPDKDVAALISRHIANTLTLKRRLIFDDMSPLMVDRNLRINLGQDPMRTGQITIDAVYGILNSYPYTPIQNLSVREKEGT